MSKPSSFLFYAPETLAAIAFHAQKIVATTQRHAAGEAFPDPREFFPGDHSAWHPKDPLADAKWEMISAEVGYRVTDDGDIVTLDGKSLPPGSYVSKEHLLIAEIRKDAKERRIASGVKVR